MSIATAKEVYNFWFNENNEENWFEKSEEFDQEIEDRFYETWDAGRQGLLYEWRETLEGRLSEIIVLDQFSRNLHRGRALSYMQDSMALILSQHAMDHSDFEDLPLVEKNFILLPWMHQESKDVQNITEEIYLEIADDELTEIMYDHKNIIDEFGRYPHRNRALGRKSTPEEFDFLESNDLDFTK